MLYKRYSNPLELMDLMIQSGRLFEFIREMIHIRNEEMEEETAWEYWLHKNFEQSWSDFRASLNDDSSTNAAPTHEELKKTVSESAKLLMNFCPYGGGDEQDGTVQAVGNDSG